MTRVISVIGMTSVLGSGFAGPVGAQEQTVYETQFLDTDQTATDWGFPPNATDVNGKGYSAAIAPGALTLTLDGAPNAWLSPDFGAGGVGKLPSDQAVEARVASSTGDKSALFGVACRAQRTGNNLGYVFLIGTDGYYAIGRYNGKGGAKAIVNANGAKRTDTVDPTGFNIVRGECMGKKKVTLTLLVNGEKVASTVDKSPLKKVGDQAHIVTEVAKGKQTATEFTGFAAHAL